MEILDEIKQMKSMMIKIIEKQDKLSKDIQLIQNEVKGMSKRIEKVENCIKKIRDILIACFKDMIKRLESSDEM